MAIIPTLTLSRAGELSRSWIPKNNKCPNSQRKKNSSWLVYVLHKMKIRHFHVVVVWWRQQNVQISVMHVQICCCSFDVLVAAVVDRILRSLFLLPLLLLIPVTRCYFHYQYQYQYHYPPPATRYSLPLTLPSTTITSADFESNQRPFRRCYWVPTWSTIMGSIPYKRQLCFSKSTFLSVARTRVWKVVEIGSRSL